MTSKSKAEEEEEVKIPVFTVLKNNTILKNIFIVNKPPSPSASRSSHEDVLMVGRHPDCDLMLTHPSISRFHLQIRSKPSSQSLFVQDLSSVHGTWISGKKVEAGASVEMKAGDTLKIGVSSRVYRLHWIPINRAYDMENLFLSQLEAVPEEEQQEEEEERKQDIFWDQKRSWDMVVDTATLMNKESRNALQLLQGLKGTQLIVPRSVIRELDSKKRKYSIFKRNSEASLALEWIEDCMVKTRWWIHVQSSMEEERLIAPTPPASPRTQFNEESWTFPAAILEIASPTAEDQILDFALAYKRRKNDGQLVLLSEDVTLKIKSMAEGLLCEPAQEFRASLVNPFSERFLWTNSSPRGQTWSCQDDHVLREKYCRLPVRKSSKGAASGLKLILLHNSQYGK